MNRRNALLLVLIPVLFFFAACANPAPKTYQLVINVEGEGYVNQNSGAYQQDTILTITVNPAPGWEFSDWRGRNFRDLIKSGTSWHLRMDGDKLLTAVFVKTSGEEDERQLTVDIQGSGSVVPKGGYYKDGTLVVLNVQPEVGWSFSHWTGTNANDVYGSGKDWTIRMNDDKRITAVFVTEESSGYKLNVNIIGQGNVEEMLVSSEYPGNSRVRLWAKPENGWMFSEWRGDFSGTDEVAFINMTKDMHVTAVFLEKNYNLSVTIVGEGRVEEQLISEEYPGGSIVKLTAKAARGWKFIEWRGAVSGKKTEIFIEIEGDTEVTAVFETSEVYLDIEIIGKGKVEEELISDIYDPNSLVRLRAIPAKDWEFKEWLGDASGKKAVIEVEMDSDKEIIAVFLEKDEFSIEITITGEGRVDETLVKNYPYGSIVKLMATPDSGWNFKEWRGDANGRSKEIEIEMDCDKEIEAVFEEIKEGRGEVSGQITMTHIWPNPYTTSEAKIAKPAKGFEKLAILDYAANRLKAENQERCAVGELVVGFKEGAMLLQEEMNILTARGLRVSRNLSAINAYVLEVPEVVDDASAYLAAANLFAELSILTNGIAYVEPNFKVYALGTANNVKYPNDTHYKHQWHYPTIRLPQAWTVSTGSKAIRIGVIDTGVAVAHPDLGANIDSAAGWNFVDNNSNFTDRFGHGSHCTGTIAADTNNNLGVAGVMWEASVIPVKALNDRGSGTASGVAEGILYAAGVGNKQINSPAQVLSMSIGLSNQSQVLEQACNRAVQEGVILVAAAGNDNGPICYPAAYESIICVGATDYNYPNAPKRANYSNYGPQMDLVAPGGDVNADTDDDGLTDGVLSATCAQNDPNDFAYFFYAGTSMACPHVVGVIGLMLENGIPQGEIREALRRTAMDIGAPGFDNEFGHGLVNAYWAVNNVKEIKIAVGTKNGNRIDAVAEGTLDLKSNSYTLGKIPEGEYKVFGWVDVQNTGTVDQGDYFFESSPIYFTGNDKQTVNINLEEIN